MGCTFDFLWGKGSLCQLEVYGVGGNPPKATEGADGSAHGDIFKHFPAALADRSRDPSRLQDSKCDACLEEGLEGGSQHQALPV